MHTKRFDVSLEYAEFEFPDSARLRARVQTDKTHHGVTQRYNLCDDDIRSTWIDLGREYTPAQREAVNRLLHHYYPIVKQQAIDWLTAHNLPTTDDVTVRLDLQYGITQVTYENRCY
jgi:hypothetical protein